MKPRLGTAIIGMGGFAGVHHNAVRALEGEGGLQLVATCDPAPERFPELTADLANRGVKIYRDYLEMLDAHPEELGLVTIATPIPLHAPQHHACAERGLGVYLEKPPTLDFRELRAMQEADQLGPFQAQVGFNFIIEDARQNLKKRILAGEFGRLERASFMGVWPRAAQYFERAAWAGKLRLNGNLVLDSCVGNAMAHYVHNLLFWCGQGEFLSWGEVEWVEAELYRAHAIQSFDTVFTRGVCSGVEFRIGATHAANGRHWQTEWLECEEASLTYVIGGGYEILWKDGRREASATDSDSIHGLVQRNIADYAEYLRGNRSRPLTTLQDCQPFVMLNDLLFVAARQIHQVPEAFVDQETSDRGENFLAIRDVEAAIQHLGATGELPSKSTAPWGRSGGERAVPDQVGELDGVIDELLLGRGGG